MKEANRHIRNWTRSFTEVKQLLVDHKTLIKQIRTINRRLKTIELKYSFLSDITSINGDDNIIELAAKRLFKSAGFVDVRHLKKVKPKREDLQIWCGDCIILVECKGSKKPIPSDDIIMAVKKYIDHRKNKVQSQLPVYGLTVLNHDNSNIIEKRRKNPIDNNKADYIEAGQYGVITSIELVNGFLLLKNNIITFEQFKNRIKQFGLITF